MQIPPEYGGLGLNHVQYARILEEVSRDGAIGVMLGAHQAIGLKVRIILQPNNLKMLTACFIYDYVLMLQS